MMKSVSLERSADKLINRLTERIDESYGLGFMSPAVYDTAWVSMVQKPVDGQLTWLFPECYEYILSNQLMDGSWITYASEIDGILNTAASLLSLKRHLNAPLQIRTISYEDLKIRIDRGTKALNTMLNTWDIDATVHVGFEILVPAILSYLEEESILFSFPGRDILFKVRNQKLDRFKPELLYIPIQSTVLHSLEAFIGLIEFDRVCHHKVNGSFMASPSSTAAVLMNSSEWDDECEEYLHHVIQYASGNGSGGVPSAFPSTIFEVTWTFSTLMNNGFDLRSHLLASVQKAQVYLHDALLAGKGTLGFAPDLCPDADDTAKSILMLQLLQQSVSLEPMLKAFELEHHFRTYPQERDPSFSANCNVLLAMLYSDDPAQYETQIEKATRFLYTHFRKSDLKVRDKWNLSPFYSWMLMTEAIFRLILLFQSSQLILLKELFKQDLTLLVRDMTISVLNQQNSTGSWGSRNSKEETAYAVLTLTYAEHFGFPEIPRRQIRTSIYDGCSFLQSDTVVGSEHLWIEKVTYESKILSQAYILAALKNAANLPLESESNGIFANKLQMTDFDEKEKKVTSSDLIASDIPLRNQTIAHDYKGQIDVKSIKTSFPKLYPPREWTDSHEKILLGPFEYLESLPGKNIRSQFMQAFNIWLQVPVEHMNTVQGVISMLHTASLLVDDIEDSSFLRRGQPAAHSIYGTAQTFNSGNYVYFLALREIQKLGSPRAIEIYIDALVQLHRGQGMDIFWRDSLTCPTEEEYLDMVSQKTGALFCLAIELLKIESPLQVDLIPLVRSFGIIFQICDDYLNLKSPSYIQKKGTCEDLTEGKFSFPIIHSIRSDPDNRQLINILKQKPQSDDIKRCAVTYMESTNTFEYTQIFINRLKAEALAEIESIEQIVGENISIRTLLARLSVDGL